MFDVSWTFHIWCRLGLLAPKDSFTFETCTDIFCDLYNKCDVLNSFEIILIYYLFLITIIVLFIIALFLK